MTSPQLAVHGAHMLLLASLSLAESAAARYGFWINPAKPLPSNRCKASISSKPGACQRCTIFKKTEGGSWQKPSPQLTSSRKRRGCSTGVNLPERFCDCSQCSGWL